MEIQIFEYTYLKRYLTFVTLKLTWKIGKLRRFRIEIRESIWNVEILKYLQSMTQEQMDKMAKGLRKSCLQKIDISEGEWEKARTKWRI